MNGRKNLMVDLQAKLDPSAKYIWIHAASLGEFEQAVPVMQMLKNNYPEYKILVSFFSPSGFENKKSHPLVDAITYLPLDTPKNAKAFVEIVNPVLAIFVKYEVWPNFLKALQKKDIRSILISGIFKENQVYFKSYAGFMKTALASFEHIFVQNKASLKVLQNQGFESVSLAGDTRFDRVSAQLSMDNNLLVIKEFISGELCFVAGSTWPEDEAILLDFINASEKTKFIIAPHEIQAEKIAGLQKKLKKKTILYSETSKRKPSDSQVLIIDNIGLLSKVYSYADVAFVGGASGTTGLHNILEPATFGVPIITGQNIVNFPEAVKLEKLAGLFSVANAEELQQIARKLTENENFRKKTGMISGHFINSNTGATRVIATYLKEKQFC